MDSQIVAQRDFSAGQIDETALRRDDTDIHRSALRTARNVRILNSGAVARRPGRGLLASTTGIVERVQPIVGDVFDMIFEAGRVTFRRPGLPASNTFTGMPWTMARLTALSWVEIGSTIVVALQGSRPRIFTFNPDANNGDGSWTADDFTFALDPTGATREPFYNFYLGSGITMRPSARSGNVTLTFSAPVLKTGHVGARFRFANRQILITSVQSSTLANASVVEQLPPTFYAQLDNIEGARVGDAVEGLTSGAKGQIVGVDPGPKTVAVLIDKNWKGFDVNETVVGPRSRGKVVSAGEGALLPSVLWDEALMSPLRGWPGTVSKDAQRVIFCNFRQLGNAIVWSATGTLNDFRIGEDKADAIFELLTANCVVQDVIGGADEFIFTDQGIYYVPISTSNPLIPGSIEFRNISDDGAAPIRPQPTPDGYVFINKSRSRVLALIGTGQSARPYVIEDISEFHSSIIRNPIKIATASSDVSEPERYLYAVNGDGTLAVARYQKQSGSKGWVGWVPWDGAGAIQWVTTNGPDVVVTVTYPNGSRFIEAFQDGLTLDASVPLDDPLSIAHTGQIISVEQFGWYRGDYTFTGTGLSGDYAPSIVTGMRGGYNFTVEVEPFVPHVDPGQSRKQRLRRRRVKQYAATVSHLGALSVGARKIAFWLAGENQEISPPLRKETYRGRMLGRDFDPRWSVKQNLPGPLTVLELTTEVTI